jgi:uncharacterized protein (TIGR03089 family)
VTTPSDLLGGELSRDGSRPLLTSYDDDTGERVELSVATTANWVAKTANLLESLGVEAGDTVGVLLPLHWQTAVVLLAAWASGAVVSFDPDDDTAVTFLGPDLPDPAAAGEVLTLSLAPMGVDFSRLVAAEPDQFVALSPTGADLVDAASVGLLPSGGRVLTTLPFDDVEGLGHGLVEPLIVGGSIVLVRSPDLPRLAERCRVERVTHTLGVDVAGLPRLDG